MSNNVEAELLALRAENARLRKTLDAVKAVQVHGARMDVNPTRLGNAHSAIEEAMWWQGWLHQFDNAWRTELKDALSIAEQEPVADEFRFRVIKEVLEQATVQEWMAEQDELVHRILDRLATAL